LTFRPRSARAAASAVRRESLLIKTVVRRVNSRSVCGLTGNRAALAPRIVVAKVHRPCVEISPAIGGQSSTVSTWWQSSP
jgi:hypothetical protein